MQIRHLTLKGMARHIAANHVELAHKLVPLSEVVTTEEYLGKLEDALRRERIAKTDDVFRREYSGMLVYVK